MRTCAFVRIPNSPLQHPAPAKHSKLFWTATVVLAAHILLLAGLLVQHGQSETGMAILHPPADGAPPAPALSKVAVTAPIQPIMAPEGSVPLAHTPAASAPATPALAPSVAQPAPSVAPADWVNYIVRPGDSLSRIARHHRTTVPALLEANGLKSDRIRAGQKLRIPAPPTP